MTKQIHNDDSRAPEHSREKKLKEQIVQLETQLNTLKKGDKQYDIEIKIYSPEERDKIRSLRKNIFGEYTLSQCLDYIDELEEQLFNCVTFMFDSGLTFEYIKQILIEHHENQIGGDS